MSQPIHSALRDSPDLSVNSANPPQIADEFVPLDAAMGGLTVNRLTYRFVRWMMGRRQPDFDRSAVVIENADTLGDGTILVTPKKRTSSGALMLIHGGGFVLGSPDRALAQASQFAVRLGVPVICAKYRLAPQAPFPAPLDDCHRVWHGLQDQAADLGIDAARIAVAGNSAGSGLAANLVNRLHDEGGVQPCAQLLIYPMLDERTAARRELDDPRHRVWSNRNNYFAWSSFLGHKPGAQCADYAAAARRENLAGLPPAWVGVGTCDLFLDEDRLYAQRLSEAGVDTTYVEADGGIHGFDMAKTDTARAFVASQLEFLQRFIG